MDVNTQTASINWGDIISGAIDHIPEYIALARNQPLQTGSLVVGPRGVSGTISPAILIIGAGALIAVILLLKK